MKKIETIIKLQIKSGQANPSPPIGPALGSRGVNIIKFCKEFNSKTSCMNNLKEGTIVPVVVTVYSDKSFLFVIKSPPASILLKNITNISKGSSNPSIKKVATISMEQIKKVVNLKKIDLIVNSENSAIKSIIGTAKSMGLEIKEN